MSVDTRNISRDSLLLFADLTIEGEPEPVRIKVRNLSSKGMMAEAGCAVSVGDRLVLNMRNIGDVKGAVVWVEGNRFGIALENKIDPKLARAPMSAGEPEAPRYSRPASTGGPRVPDGLRARKL